MGGRQRIVIFFPLCHHYIIAVIVIRFYFCLDTGFTVSYVTSMCCGSEHPSAKQYRPIFLLIPTPARPPPPRLHETAGSLAISFLSPCPSSPSSPLSLFLFHEPGPFTTHRHHAAQLTPRNYRPAFSRVAEKTRDRFRRDFSVSSVSSFVPSRL